MAQSKSWMFTINNYTEDDNPLDWLVNYVIYQQEIGAEGTPHLQGYAEFEKRIRLTGLKKIHPTAHWEPRAGTQAQAIAYCSKKDETYVAGPWEAGEAATTAPGKRSDLEAVGEKIKAGATMAEIANDHPGLYIQYARGFKDLAQTTQKPYDHDSVRGEWYWGEPGTGKSLKAREENPGAYLKNQNKWWDNYMGEDSVILDDLDKLGGDKLGHHLKIWADRYACSGEVKGSMVHLRHKKFIVTSNYHPRDIWPDDEEMLTAIRRRFAITKFSTLGTWKAAAQPVGMDEEAEEAAQFDLTTYPGYAPGFHPGVQSSNHSLA